MGAFRLQLGVIGSGARDDRLDRLARQTGEMIARHRAVLLCGGRGGVMEAAAAGAREAGGHTVGILPGAGPAESPPNSSIELSVYTGMGQARNLVLVLSTAAVIAIGGGWGTLSEIGLALKHGVPIVLLSSWHLERPDGAQESLLQEARDPEEAVRLAIRAARDRGRWAPGQGSRETVL
jgi:uncharacterized protein (TIGR00725 family)